MAVFIVWFYNMSDRIEPEMRFSSYDLLYDENTVDADLLNGVSAYDAVDGDITDRIVVEKTILNEAQSSAVVYYAVSDKSGNVTKQSRVFPADIASIRNGGSVLFSTDQNFEGYPEANIGDGFNTDGFNTEGFETDEGFSEEGAGTDSGFGATSEAVIEGDGTSETQEGESTGN